MPAARPVLVTGMHWTGALLAGLEGIPNRALMSGWTTQGTYATPTSNQEEEMLRKCSRKWGDLLVHVFDRGDASGPWIQVLETLHVKFVIRWIKQHTFFESNGVQKTVWQSGRGKKYRAHTDIFDVPTGQKMPCDRWWTQVWHASYAYPLFCVTVRVKKKICYLITNEPVKTEAQAWEGVFT